MSAEKDLAKKLLDALKTTQPKITKSQDKIEINYRGGAISLPLQTFQIESDRPVSFR